MIRRRCARALLPALPTTFAVHTPASASHGSRAAQAWPGAVGGGAFREPLAHAGVRAAAAHGNPIRRGEAGLGRGLGIER